MLRVYCLWLSNKIFPCTQGVLKVRKRVTLMVVTVSVIFVISWGTDRSLHIVEMDSYELNLFATSIGHTMIMFNSAVNPFAYALINQRFRETIKEMICCCSRSASPRVHAQGVELANNPTLCPFDPAGSSVTGWCAEENFLDNPRPATDSSIWRLKGLCTEIFTFLDERCAEI